MRCRFVMPWRRLRVRSQLSMAMWLRRRALPRSCSTAPENLGLPWIARGHCFQGTLLIMRRDFVAGLPLLRDALEEMREGGAAPGYPAFLTLFARGLGLAGQVTEGLAVIDQALELSERHEERWSLPEVLRNKGELLLLGGLVGAAVAAEDCFRQALDWAHRDGTLSYELRAAFSLGRLRRDQGRSSEADDLVAAVYGRFTEGLRRPICRRQSGSSTS